MKNLFYFNDYVMRFALSSYSSNCSSAIYVEYFNPVFSSWCVYCVLSVNLPDYHFLVSRSEVFIDTNNLPSDFIDFLMSLGFFDYVGLSVSSGFCSYPLCDVTNIIEAVKNG